MPHLQEGNGGEEPDESYSAMTKDELQEELAKRDLPVSGNKPELIERLEQDDGEA